MDLKKTLKSKPLTIKREAPVRKGMVKLMFSNMNPARVGAIVRKPILAKLLTPMAVAVSSGATIPVAKDCLIGMENNMTRINALTKTTAKGNDVVKENNTVRLAAARREATRVCTSPNRCTIMGTRM